MIGRQGAIACRQLGAAEIGQLLGMQLDRNAERPGAVEDAGNLFRRKGDALAETVDRIDQPFGMRGFKTGDADLVDIGVGAALVFRWHGMGAEIAGPDPHRSVCRQRRAPRAASSVRFDVEPVAGLDLDGGDALGDHRIDAGERTGKQFILGVVRVAETVETIPPPARATSS
jgi:hypothetical protein